MATHDSLFNTSLMVSTVLLSFAASTQDVQAPANNVTDTNRPRTPNLTGIGRIERPDGFRFSSQAYQREAFRLLLQEANKFAEELHLPEKLPITECDVAQRFIVAYRVSQMYPGMI